MNRHNRYKYDFYKQMPPNERILHRFEKRLVRGLQGILFSDALDFMYDDTLDAKLRKDGINPMKDTYVALHKAKQHALYGEPPMYDCRCIPDGADYCTVSNFVIDHINEAHKKGIKTEVIRDTTMTALSIALHPLVFPEEYGWIA